MIICFIYLVIIVLILYFIKLIVVFTGVCLKVVVYGFLFTIALKFIER